MRFGLLLLLPFLLLIVACGDSGDDRDGAASPTVANTTAATATVAAEPEHQTVELTVSGGGNEQTVVAEVVFTIADRQQGLMFREAMDEHAGMLFLFPADQLGGFWMKDTLLPLDIAYLSAAGEVQEVRQGMPLSEMSLTPEQPYRHTLEMNAGWFEANGFGVGSVVELPAGLPEAE